MAHRQPHRTERHTTVSQQQPDHPQPADGHSTSGTAGDVEARYHAALQRIAALDAEWAQALHRLGCPPPGGSRDAGEGLEPSHSRIPDGPMCEEDH